MSVGGIRGGPGGDLDARVCYRVGLDRILGAGGV